MWAENEPSSAVSTSISISEDAATVGALRAHCVMPVQCDLSRSDPAHPLPADQQKEVEGLQDPRVHRRQDQQD